MKQYKHPHRAGTIAVGAMVVLLVTATTAAGASRNAGERPARDLWGNAYKRQTNLFRDRDNNGVINLFQQRDRAPKAIRQMKDRKRKQRR